MTRNYDCSKLKDVIFKKKDGRMDDSKEKFCERLAYFADNFQKEFLNKVDEYKKEVEGVKTKLHKRTEIGKSIVGQSIIGAANLTLGIKINSSAINPVSDPLSEILDTHREKARDVILKLEIICNNPQPNELIRIATQVFATYEEQFTTTAFKTDKEWSINRKGLIGNAIKTIMDYILEMDDAVLNEKRLEEIVMESLISSKDTSAMPATLKSVIKKGKRVSKKGYNEWTFKRLNEKSGFLIENKYYWSGTEIPKFGFKKIATVANSFSDLIDEYKGEFNAKYKYKLDLSLTNLNATVRAIEEISADRVTGDGNDIHSRMIKDNKKQQTKLKDISKNVKISNKTNQIVMRTVQELNVNVREGNKVMHEIKNKLMNNEEDEGMKQKEIKNEVKSEEILSPVTTFTGRKDELNEIHEKLHLSNDEDSQARIWHTVCVCGLGGMGKTELSRKYVQLYRQEYDENIYWINADNITYDAEAINEFYEKEIHTKTQNKILIILDNAHTFDDVEPFFPKVHMDNIFFIITSRSKNWDAQQEGEIQLIELKTFKEARELIEKKIPSEGEKDVNKLIDIVEGLPLALQQAISFITTKQQKKSKLKRNSRYTISDYVEEYRKNSKPFLNDNFDQRRYLQTVYNTWNVTFKQIEQNEEYGRKAIEIMRIIAYLYSTFNVSYLIENNGFDENAFLLLEEYSLINIFDKEWNDVTWASVHRLIQEVIRMQIQEDVLFTNLEETILTKVISLKDIFKNVNLYVFSKRLLDEKNMHILKEYCQKSRIDEIPFDDIFLCGGGKIFEKMWEQECFKMKEEQVIEAIVENVEDILDTCNLNVGKEILNKLEGKGELLEEKLYDLIGTFVKNGRVDVIELLSSKYCVDDEIERQTFKLLALLYNKDKGKETLVFLSQIKDNLATISKLAPEHLKKLYYSFKDKDLLEVAINSDHPGILDYILRHLKQDGTRHLRYAIHQEKENAFHKLANDYFQLNKDLILINDEKDEEGLNLFDYACVHGTLNIVKYLERAGCKNSDNLIFYFLYYLYCKLEVFKYVFNNNVIDSLGRTALVYAARIGRDDLLQYLIEESIIPATEEEDKEGNSPLHYAVSLCDMNTRIEKHYVLSGRGYSINIKTDIMNFIMKAGVDPSKRNLYGQTALMVAAYYHKGIAIDCFLSTIDSALINQCDVVGRTPLHYAAMSANYKEITNVIETQLFSTTLSFSPQQKFISTFINDNAIKILFHYGADIINVKDNFGCLPTHYACMHFQSLTECELFGFKTKEWSTLKDSQGNTPFHYAAINENICLLNEVKEKNYSNLNVVINNNKNQSLLHFFAISNMERYDFLNYNDYKDVLNWLINEKHLDINLKDVNGLTPIDYAHKSNNQTFINAIKEITF